MRINELKRAFRQGPAPKRLKETQELCAGLLKDGLPELPEERIGFREFLSDVFRFIGLRLWAAHALMLLAVCAGILSMPQNPAVIPFFMPLFALACLPSLYRSRTCGMEEIEAATKASGAQLAIAKLILAGAADLICLSVIFIVIVCFNMYEISLFQLILYMIVPLLFCLVAVLWCMRRFPREGFRISVSVCLGACLLLGVMMKAAPHLYEMSAIGLWGAAFALSAAFFLKEIRILVSIKKEGKVYGINAR